MTLPSDMETMHKKRRLCPPFTSPVARWRSHATIVKGTVSEQQHRERLSHDEALRKLKNAALKREALGTSNLQIFDTWQHAATGASFKGLAELRLQSPTKNDIR